MGTRNNYTQVDVRIPTTTFDWKTEKGEGEFENEDIIIRQQIQTQVPIVPAHLLPKGRLDNYYILFEVNEWTEQPVPPVAKDPYLLRRINSNTFVILAEWDLTEVEQAIMRGL